MNENIGLLVRDSLDSLTEGATAPAGLVARARRQHNRRVAVVRISAAAVTAAVTTAAVAAAVIIAGGAGIPSRPPAPMSLTAYVVAHAEHALAAPGSRAVVQSRATILVNQTSTELLSWSDASASKTELATASGQPLQAGGYVLRSGRVAVVTIDYQNRTWRQRSIPAAAAAPLTATVFPLQTMFGLQLAQLTRGCAAWDAPSSAPFAFSWAGRIRQLLSCRSFKVAGHAQIDGVAVIKLVPVVTAQPGPDSAVLWVSQANYLPLRLAFAGVPGAAAQVPGAPAATGYQVNLRWLPATSANRAMARVLPAPRGFTRVRWPAG